MPELVDAPEEKIIQAYGMMYLENKHRLVKDLKRYYKPSIHGHKTWDSSFLLMDYLLHQAILDKKRPVLEIGCGWGQVSIFCARHSSCKVLATDMDENVFPYLNTQAALNSAQVETEKKSFQKLSKKKLAGFHTVLATDVCFWDELVKIQFNLVKRALAAGVKHIIYADPGRSPFQELAKICEDQGLNSELREWYCLEPKEFEGYNLHIKG